MKERPNILGKIARGAVTHKRATVQDYAEEWLAGLAHPRESSVRRYKSALETHVFPRWGSRKLSEITPADVAELVGQMQRDGKAYCTIMAVLTPLGMIFKKALRDGEVRTNPVSQLHSTERPRRQRRRKRILDRDEIGLLLDAASPEVYRLLFELGIFTGVRISEAAALRWEDIDFGEGVIHIHRSKSEDGAREIVLIPSLQRALNAHSLVQPPATEWVFPSPAKPGEPISQSAIKDALARALKRAGLPHARFHDLRHTYASLLISNPMNDLVFVSRQLGHASVKMTLDVYADLFDARSKRDRLREQMEADYGRLVLGGTRGSDTPLVAARSEDSRSGQSVAFSSVHPR